MTSRIEMANKQSHGPFVLEKELRSRIANDRQVSDDAVLGVVSAWMLYESPRVGNPGKKDSTGRLFPHTYKLISDLIPLMQDRPMLLGNLHRQKAELLLIDDRSKEAVDELDKTIAICTKLSSSGELQRLEALSRLGSLVALWDKKRAEAAFLEVLSFEYYQLPSQDAQIAREYYIGSGRGLIACRQFDLNALRNTFFLEPTQDELYPIRDMAIRRLESAAGKGGALKCQP